MAEGHNNCLIDFDFQGGRNDRQDAPTFRNNKQVLVFLGIQVVLPSQVSIILRNRDGTVQTDYIQPLNCKD